MKHMTCTIRDCEFDSFVPGVLINNKIYALNENNKPVPARNMICEHVDFGMVQFYIGFYDPYGDVNNSTAKWGYFRLSSGEIVVPTVYEHAYPFYGNRAKVKKNGKYGFIDPYGNVVVDLVWDDSDNAFIGGLCPVKRAFMWGYIDESGTMVVQPRYEFAGEFTSNKTGVFTALVKSEGKYGYLNCDGQVITEPIFDEAMEFWYKGYAPVMIKGVWGFIDVHGNYAVAFQFEQVSPYYYYCEFCIVKKHGQWGIMDEYLNVFMPETGVRYVIYGV